MSPEEREYLQNLDPRDALFLFVKGIIEQYTKQTTSNWELAIIDRESWYPSPVFEEVVDEFFRPEMDFIANIISHISGKSADSHEVRFAIIGLVGLLTLYGYYDYFIDAVAPDLRKTFHEEDWLVKNIIHMVLAAVEQQETEES